MAGPTSGGGVEVEEHEVRIRAGSGCTAGVILVVQLWVSALYHSGRHLGIGFFTELRMVCGRGLARTRRSNSR